MPTLPFRCRYALTSLLFATCIPNASIADPALVLELTAEEVQALGLKNLSADAAKVKLLLGVFSQQANKNGVATTTAPTAPPSPVKPQASVIPSSAEAGPIPPPMAKLLAIAPPIVTTPPSASLNSAATVLSEAELAKLIADCPPLSGPLIVERKKDGFEVNGKRHLDPEGSIGLYGLNTVTGDVTYLANTGAGYLIKTLRLGGNTAPITIAKATESPMGWSIQTTSGLTLIGNRLVLGSLGFMVTRASGDAAFLYVPGQGSKTIALPDGYRIAQFQNGDVVSTRYLLMEKIKESNPQDPLAAFKSIGAILGVNRKDDYAMLDIDQGQPLFVNVPDDGKNQTVLSNCRQRSPNSLINYCNTATTFESLYDPRTGLPNFTHYYWRLSWYKTPDGRRVLIAQEGGLSDVSIINMDTGSKTELFHRTLGIAGFSSEQKSTGEIQVTAKMGLTRERVNDALAILDGATPKPETVGGMSLF